MELCTSVNSRITRCLAEWVQISGKIHLTRKDRRTMRKLTEIHPAKWNEDEKESSVPSCIPFFIWSWLWMVGHGIRQFLLVGSYVCERCGDSEPWAYMRCVFSSHFRILFDFQGLWMRGLTDVAALIIIWTVSDRKIVVWDNICAGCSRSTFHRRICSIYNWLVQEETVKTHKNR